MFKKITIFSLILTVLFINNFSVLADDEIDNVEISGLEEVIETAIDISNEPKINSRLSSI